MAVRLAQTPGQSGLRGRPAEFGLRRAGVPAPARPGGTSRLSVCLYTPSVDPSGMGTHMLDLAAAYLPDVQVSVMCWPTTPGQRVLARAAALGATPLALPHPRSPSFADTVVHMLQEHTADVFHVHVGTGREDFDGARAARRAGVGAVVQTLHLPWLLADRGKRRPFFRAVREVDRLIAVSQAQRATYERIGVPPGQLTTVPNGISARRPGPGRRAAREALGLRPDQPVVMTIGRLTVMKGQRYLVESVPHLADRFPDLAVLVLGQGHLQAQLEEQAAALGVQDCVRLLGHRTDARMLLDAADVFVLPSRHEGMPLAAMEAMEAGLPVVATRVIGSEEVVADGESGLLVPPQDADALAEALATLLAHPELRARYGAAGRRRYLKQFTSERMAEQTVAVYEQVRHQEHAGARG